MHKKRGFVFNSVSGRPNSFANVDMVQSITIVDQEMNVPAWKVKVHLWNTIKELKQKIQLTTGHPAHRQRLFFNNLELMNEKTLDEYNLLAKRNTIILRLRPDIESMKSYIDAYGSVPCSKRMKKTIEQIRQAFNIGLKPKLTDEGTSGTYEMRDIQKQKIAIFKPIDEEPFAPNNPRGNAGPFGSQTFRQGVLSGESCIREVAAYLLDHQHFSRVPPTTFVEVVHQALKYIPFTGLEVTSKEYLDIMASLITPIVYEKEPDDKLNHTPDSLASTASTSKIGGIHQAKFDINSSIPARLAKEQQIGLKFGSLQQYVNSEGPIENFSSDMFSKDEIHKIAILDIRLMNLDRNECNILVQTKVDRKTGKRTKKLIPIDHGLCIPDNLAVCSFDLCWLSYDQANEPFSKKTLAYIESIDIKQDIKLLESTFKFRPVCLRNIRISSTLLQKGAATGLTLAQIGQILCRPDDDETVPSLLERIVNKARLIADMMLRMQAKLKDTNLRVQDRFDHLNNSGKKKFDEELDEFKNQKRNRATSSIGIPLKHTLSEKFSSQSQPLTLPFLSTLKQKIGFCGLAADDSEDLPHDKRQRGMSGVDDNNLFQANQNVSTMIETHLQRHVSNKASAGESSSYTSSPIKCFQSAKDECEDNGKPHSGSPSDIDNDRANSDEEEKNEDDEFFDCVDNQLGIDILNHHDIEEQEEKPQEKPAGLRRTASFTNIQIQEAAESDEEEKTSQHAKNNQYSPNDGKSKFNKMKEFEKLKKGMGLGNQGGNSRSAKSYFEDGSMRNTAHDEEFFHCFVQYLEEAIKKVKEQGGAVDID